MADRAHVRAALIRLWGKRGLLRVLVPLTGPGALGADAPAVRSAWVVGFLSAVAHEAEGSRKTLRALEQEWIALEEATTHLEAIVQRARHQLTNARAGSGW